MPRGRKFLLTLRVPYEPVAAFALAMAVKRLELDLPNSMDNGRFIGTATGLCWRAEIDCYYYAERGDAVAKKLAEFCAGEWFNYATYAEEKDDGTE